MRVCDYVSIRGKVPVVIIVALELESALVCHNERT